MSISDRPYGTTANQPPLSLLLAAPVDWSTEFIVIDSSMRLADALDRIRSAATPWIVLRCQGGSYLCADVYCRRYMAGGRQQGEVTTGQSHTGFRCVR